MIRNLFEIPRDVMLFLDLHMLNCKKSNEKSCQNVKIVEKNLPQKNQTFALMIVPISIWEIFSCTKAR